MKIGKRKEERSFWLDLRDRIVYPDNNSPSLPKQGGVCALCGKGSDGKRIMVDARVCSDLKCIKKLYKEAVSTRGGNWRVLLALMGLRFVSVGKCKYPYCRMPFEWWKDAKGRWFTIDPDTGLRHKCPRLHY